MAALTRYIQKNSASAVAAGSRSIGGGTVAVRTGQGAAFAAASPSAPMRLAVHRGLAGEFVTLLRCVGATGDVLAIDGTADGVADAAVDKNDSLVNAQVAGDLDDAWDALQDHEDRIEDLEEGGPGGGSLAIGSTVSGGTAGRVLFVDASGDLGQDAGLAYSAADDRLGIARTAPEAGLDVGLGKGLKVRNALDAVVSEFDGDGFGFVFAPGWVLADRVDLAAGTSLLRSPRVMPFAGRIVKVLVTPATNGSSGGFQFDVRRQDSASVFASARTVAPSVTATQTFSSLTSAAAFAAGDSFNVDVASPGTGVQNVQFLLVCVVGNR